MTKSQYISLILLLIYAASLVNLFYRPRVDDDESLLTGNPSSSSSFVPSLFSSTCPFFGVRCPDAKDCDCRALCPGGDFVPFRVHGDAPVFLMNHRLVPGGTYCVPRGVGSCNQRTNYHVFSSTGWKCVPRNRSLYDDAGRVACSNNDEAADDSLNVLWDYLLDVEAGDEIGEDPYAVLPDGTPRYRCRCGSVDLRGLQMVPSLPFVCSVDYCLRDVPSPLEGMGFDGKECKCGPYLHADARDPRSPCVLERTEVKRDGMTGRVDCTHGPGVRKNIYCPPNEGALRFVSRVNFSGDAVEFVKEAIARRW